MRVSSSITPDLTLADLAAAWEYYAKHRDEIDQVIQEAEVKSSASSLRI